MPDQTFAAHSKVAGHFGHCGFSQRGKKSRTGVADNVLFPQFRLSPRLPAPLPGIKRVLCQKSEVNPSVVNRSPSILLRELILVDDFSNRSAPLLVLPMLSINSTEFLGTELENFLRTLSVPSKLLRAHQRVGLIRARLMGAQEATGVVLTFLDVSAL